jgi:hypothetical protein
VLDEHEKNEFLLEALLGSRDRISHVEQLDGFHGSTVSQQGRVAQGCRSLGYALLSDACSLDIGMSPLLQEHTEPANS